MVGSCARIWKRRFQVLESHEAETWRDFHSEWDKVSNKKKRMFDETLALARRRVATRCLLLQGKLGNLMQ